MQSLTTSWQGLPFSISASQITARVNHTPPYAVSNDHARFKLLDRSTMKPISTGDTGPLGDAGDITRYVTAGSIQNDTTQAVHRQMDCTIAETGGFRYDPLHHYIQPFWDWFDNSTGNLLFEVPLGVFGFVSPVRTGRDSGLTSQVTLLDPTFEIAQLPFLNTWVVPAGKNYVQAIVDMLTTSYLPASQAAGTGITAGKTPSGLDMAGPNIPASRIAIDPTAFVTPGTIPFGRDMNMLEAVNRLLTAINYWPLWCDSRGVFRSSPRPNLTASIPTPGWTYTADENAVIMPDWQWRVINQADLANIVAVYCEPTNGPAFSATVFNNKNTLSQLCLSVLKRSIVKVIKDPTIPDQASCTLRAYVELTQAALAAAQATFGSTINPFHESHEPLSLTILDQYGVPVIASPNNWEEIGWVADLKARTCQRTIGAYFLL